VDATKSWHFMEHLWCINPEREVQHSKLPVTNNLVKKGHAVTESIHINAFGHTKSDMEPWKPGNPIKKMYLLFVHTAS